tara:strand:+ start:384 stop:737 length:354 start_codon:yes stop_codon:yes gene_type:complete
MNDFYKNKTALPKQVKNSSSLQEALQNWRDFRLLRVANLCMDLDDHERQEFGKFHLEFIEVINVLLEKRNLRQSTLEWYELLKSDFENITPFNKGGARINALGICGAELGQILNMRW